MFEERLGLTPLDDPSKIVERLARELERVIKGERGREQHRDPFHLCHNDARVLLITLVLRTADGDLEAPAKALRALEAQDAFQYLIGCWTERRATRLTLTADMLRQTHRTLTGMAEAVELRIVERQLRDKASMTRVVMATLRAHQERYEKAGTLFRASGLGWRRRKAFIMELLRLEERGLLYRWQVRSRGGRVRNVFALSFVGKRLCTWLKIRGVARK